MQGPLISLEQAATNAGAELRRLQDETRDNLRTQPAARQNAHPGWNSPSAQAAAASQPRLYVQGYTLIGVTRFSDAQLIEVL